MELESHFETSAVRSLFPLHPPVVNAEAQLFFSSDKEIFSPRRVAGKIFFNLW